MGGQALYYGMNALSHNVIMADRKKLKSANGMYLGSTGSGKSFAAKRELINVFLATSDRIVIVDPMGEYSPLVRRLGGQVIEIAPDSPHHINPMDIEIGLNDEDSPLSMKADFLLSLCELVVGGKDGLQPIYERIFDEIRDEWSDEYYLTPIEEADVNTLLRDWNRWRDTVQNERPLDSYYSLEDKANYLRIIELSEQKRAYKKVTVFHGRYDKGYIPIEYYVEWRE